MKLVKLEQQLLRVAFSATLNSEYWSYSGRKGVVGTDDALELMFELFSNEGESLVTHASGFGRKTADLVGQLADIASKVARQTDGSTVGVTTEVVDDTTIKVVTTITPP